MIRIYFSLLFGKKCVFFSIDKKKLYEKRARREAAIYTTAIYTYNVQVFKSCICISLYSVHMLFRTFQTHLKAVIEYRRCRRRRHRLRRSSCIHHKVLRIRERIKFLVWLRVNVSPEYTDKHLAALYIHTYVKRFYFLFHYFFNL